jgi:hypothetical protein
MWGSEEYVRDLFGDRVDSLEMTRREYVERAPDARAYLNLFRQTFGPMVAIYQSLADQPNGAPTWSGPSSATWRAGAAAARTGRCRSHTSTCWSSRRPRRR